MYIINYFYGNPPEEVLQLPAQEPDRHRGCFSTNFKIASVAAAVFAVFYVYLQPHAEQSLPFKAVQKRGPQILEDYPSTKESTWLSVQTNCDPEQLLVTLPDSMTDRLEILRKLWECSSPAVFFSTIPNGEEARLPQEKAAWEDPLAHAEGNLSTVDYFGGRCIKTNLYSLPSVDLAKYQECTGLATDKILRCLGPQFKWKYNTTTICAKSVPLMEIVSGYFSGQVNSAPRDRLIVTFSDNPSKSALLQKLYKCSNQGVSEPQITWEKVDGMLQDKAVVDYFGGRCIKTDLSQLPRVDLLRYQQECDGRPLEQILECMGQQIFAFKFPGESELQHCLQQKLHNKVVRPMITKASQGLAKYGTAEPRGIPFSLDSWSYGLQSDLRDYRSGSGMWIDRGYELHNFPAKRDSEVTYPNKNQVALLTRASIECAEEIRIASAPDRVNSEDRLKKKVIVGLLSASDLNPIQVELAAAYLMNKEKDA
jgi:hypothetical protein